MTVPLKDEKIGLALLLALGGAGLASILLSMPKFAGGDIPAIQITFMRYLTGVATLICYYGLKGRLFHGAPDELPSSKYWTFLHILRAVMAVTRITCAFSAILLIPIANAQAIILTNGAFMMLFAGLILKEKVPPVAVILGIICLAGGVLAADPDFSDTGSWLSPGAVLAFVAAIIFGLESIIIKYTAERDNNRRILFVVNLAALAMTGVPAYLFWTPLNGVQWLFMLALGPIAILVQTCNIEALRRARASIIVPMRYTMVIFGILIGVLFFAEIPSPQAMIGIAMIALSGAYLAWTTSAARQRRLVVG